MVSNSVCQVGCPGSSLVHSACFRKVRFYQNVMTLSPPVRTTCSRKAVHVLSCLSDNACKRSLAVCRRSSCLISRLMSSRSSGFKLGSICLFEKGGNLSACYQLAPTSGNAWFTKGRSMCYHVYVIMHVKDP